MNSKTNKTRKVIGSVIVASDRTNAGATVGSWATDVKAKVNGEVLDVVLWTTAASKPEYAIGDKVDCVIEINKGEVYFKRVLIDESELEDVTI